MPVTGTDAMPMAINKKKVERKKGFLPREKPHKWSAKDEKAYQKEVKKRIR